MGSTFFSLHYHIVFSTKARRPLIHVEWRSRLHCYLGGIIRGMNGVPEIVGGVTDHVHFLASLRPAMEAPCDLPEVFDLRLLSRNPSGCSLDTLLGP